MVPRTIKRLSIYATCLLLGISLVGCEKIKSLTEDFTKKQDKKPATQAAAPVSPSPNANNDKGPLPANAIARVGNWTLTINDFNKRLAVAQDSVQQRNPEFNVNDSSFKAAILNELLNQQLLVFDAEKKGLDKRKEISENIDEFRRTILIQELVKDLTENVIVSDQQAREFYENQKDVLIGPAEWKVREIVVDTQDRAKELLVQILQGAEFAGVAQQNSTSESAANGGDLGLINDVPFAEMANPLLALEPGDVSGVFEGPDGFYIIKLEEKQGGEPLAFEDIKEEIILNQTFVQQQQALINHLDKLSQVYNVEVNNDLLK